jgi:hypothetical protein
MLVSSPGKGQGARPAGGIGKPVRIRAEMARPARICSVNEKLPTGD